MSFWTSDKVKEMRKLWDQGFSAARIAVIIEAPSRNAVISKLRRMGGSQRMKLPETTRKTQLTKPTNKQLNTSIKRLRTLASEMAKADPAAIPPSPSAFEGGDEPLGVLFMDLENHSCRWILGEVAGVNTLFCGAHREFGFSYCPEHHELSRNKKPNKGHFAIRRKAA